MRTIALVAFLAACSPPQPRLGVLLQGVCVCGDDAGFPVIPDAQPDAPPRVIDLAAPWTLHTIYNGSIGADGVDLADVDGDGDLDITSAWEEGRKVTVSLRPAGALVDQPWPTVIVGTFGNAYGPEDAKFADIDGDGHVDVVSATQAGKTLSIHFAPSDPAQLLTASAWTTTVIPGSVGEQDYMQVAIADIDGDGKLDIAAGGTRGPTLPGPSGYVEWWRQGPTPRTGASWSRTQVIPAGWIMSLLAVDVDHDGDIDLVDSDRLFYQYVGGGSSGAKDNTYYGLSWSENLGGGASWASHKIVQTAGDPTFITLDDWDHDADTDIVYGTIKSPSAGLRVRLNTGAWATWSETTLPRPSNFGEYQGEAIGDLDGDGLRDVVATASSADSAISGVVWLRAPNWDRGEISGVPGSKYDNVVLDDIDGDGDLDVVTSEQNGNSNADPSGRLGVVWYENPLVP